MMTSTISFQSESHFMAIVQLQLSVPESATFAEPSSTEKPRQFTGVAHSGQPFSKYGERYVVDLSNIQYRNPIGVLLEHDSDRKTGVASLNLGTSGLHITGTLLSTEHGNHVAQTASEGYPWEMSARIQSARQEKITSGEIVVNGQTLVAPIVVLRDCMVREVSFVAVGADAYTSALMLSDGTEFSPNLHLSDSKNPPTQTKDAPNMTPEEQKQFDDLKKELAETKAELAKVLKKNQVDKKLSAAGFQAAEHGFAGITKQTYNVLLSLNDDAALDALVGDLKLTAPSTKPSLPESLTADKHQPDSSGSLKLSAETKPTALGGYPMV